MLRILYIREPIQLQALHKKHIVRTPPLVKHPNLIPLLNMLPLLNHDLTCTHFRHANAQKAHHSNLLTIRLEKDNRARSRGSKIPLPCLLTLLVDIAL